MSLQGGPDNTRVGLNHKGVLGEGISTLKDEHTGVCVDEVRSGADIRIPSMSAALSWITPLSSCLRSLRFVKIYAGVELVARTDNPVYLTESVVDHLKLEGIALMLQVSFYSFEARTMPIYEYECTSCSHHLEVFQKINDALLSECPECGKSSLRKLISAAAFRLKGTGWYETDFKNKGKPEEKDKKKEASEDTKSDKKADKKSDTKSDKKPEKKTATAATAD